MLAVYIYDLILTTPLEIQQIWPARFTLTTLAYALNRYGNLIYIIFNTIFSYSIIGSVSVSVILNTWISDK